MKILSIILTLIISSVVTANQGYLVVHAEVKSDSAVGTARTILVSNSEYITSSPELSTDEVKAKLKNSFSVLFNIKSGAQAYPCMHAIITFSAGEGNFLPLADGDDNYFMPELISFFCIR